MAPTELWSSSAWGKPLVQGVIPIVDHPARPCPAWLSRSFILLFTLASIFSLAGLQQGHPALRLFIALQVLSAFFLILRPNLTDGFLLSKAEAWFWRDAKKEQPVVVHGVLDLPGLLCLRLSPSDEHARAWGRRSHWVWLVRSDPKAWMDIRLALKCSGVF